MKWQQPLISIVVPVYNAEAYLERCHKSLTHQDYGNIELIYVDDGSTDNSGELCERLAADSSNVIVVHKENGGLGYARNTGMNTASGEYVVFVDSDDYIDQDLVSRLARPVIMGTAGYTLSGFTRVKRKGYSPSPLPDIGVVYEGNKAVLDNILCRMFGEYPGRNDYIEMSCCARLYNLKIIREHEIMFNSERECISEDIDFNARYLQYISSALCVDSVGYYYCDNQDSLTTSYRVDRFDKQIILSEKLRSIVSKLGLCDEAYARIDCTLAAIARYSIKLEVLYSDESGRKEASKRIQSICRKKKLKEALNNLANYSLPLQNEIVNSMIKHECVNLLFFTMKLKLKLNL